MRDPETGNSRGFGFVSYDSFESSDQAIEVMYPSHWFPVFQFAVVLAVWHLFHATFSAIFFRPWTTNIYATGQSLSLMLTRKTRKESAMAHQQVMCGLIDPVDSLATSTWVTLQFTSILIFHPSPNSLQANCIICISKSNFHSWSWDLLGSALKKIWAEAPPNRS